MSDTAEREWMVTPIKIVEQTGIDRSALNRFLSEPGVRRWLGGETSHPNYPEAFLPAFRWMTKKFGEGMKPKALSAIVGDWPVGAVPDESPVLSSGSPETVGTGEDLEPSPVSSLQFPIPGTTSVSVEKAIDYFSDRLTGTMIERLKEVGVLPTREDRLLTRAQAAELLACDPAAVGRRVKPVSRETWSYLMIQDYIEELRARAADRARIAAEKKAAKAGK